MEALTPEIVGIDSLEITDEAHLVPAISNPAMLFQMRRTSSESLKL
jgi:hypothetical protein